MTIASNDMVLLERGFQIFSFIITCPVIAIITCIMVGVLLDWVSGLLTYILYLVIIAFQFVMTRFQKQWQIKEAGCTDKQIKFIGDIITGARTIKAYGWEENYEQSVMTWRRSQLKFSLRNMLYHTFSSVVFANAGILIGILVFLYVIL